SRRSPPTASPWPATRRGSPDSALPTASTRTWASPPDRPVTLPHAAAPSFATPLLVALLAACAGQPTREAAPAAAPGAVHEPATRGVAAAGAETPADADAVVPGVEGDALDAPADDADAAGDAAPTQAELDYAAIYGGPVYDPVADPTLPEPAALPPPAHGPWERWTRRVHGFTMPVDRTRARPPPRPYVN